MVVLACKILNIVWFFKNLIAKSYVNSCYRIIYFEGKKQTLFSQYILQTIALHYPTKEWKRWGKGPNEKAYDREYNYASLA